MVRNELDIFLTSLFELPVVESFEQTNVERSIMYDISGDISIRPKNDYLVFNFNFKLFFRCENGFAGIGYLTAVIYDLLKNTDSCIIKSISGENVEYLTKTEMIISKNMNAQISIEYNKVRETIKIIKMG